MCVLTLCLHYASYSVNDAVYIENMPHLSRDLRNNISLLVLSENIHWNSVSEWYKLLNIFNGHTYLSHIRVYKYLNMIINTILRKKNSRKDNK